MLVPWETINVLTSKEKEGALNEQGKKPVWAALEEGGAVNIFHVDLASWFGVIVRPYRYQNDPIRLEQELVLYGSLAESIKIRREHPELLGASREECSDPNCQGCNKDLKGER